MSEVDREEDGQRAKMTVQRKHWAAQMACTIDDDGSGAIDFREFQALETFPQMLSWFEDAGLSEEGKQRLFMALVDRQTGEINFEQFMNILSRMMEPVHSSDLMIISYEIRKVLA